MKRIAVYGLLGVWLACCVAGCVETVDPITGEERVALDPNATAVVVTEQVAKGVSGVAPLFGTVGIAIGSVLTGVLGAWYRIKPRLTAAKSEAAQYHAVAASTVEALEAFKVSNPEQWAQLGTLISEQLTRQGVDPKVVENVIRALRGLPPKS
jgi:hypothetical protein